MTDLHALYEVIETLSDADKRQLMAYLQRQSPKAERQPRILDMHRGAMIMREDFDEELGDDFWLGEE